MRHEAMPMLVAISFQKGQSLASGVKPGFDYENEGGSDAGIGKVVPITSIDSLW